MYIKFATVYATVYVYCLCHRLCHCLKHGSVIVHYGIVEIKLVHKMISVLVIILVLTVIIHKEIKCNICASLALQNVSILIFISIYVLQRNQRSRVRITVRTRMCCPFQRKVGHILISPL